MHQLIGGVKDDIITFIDFTQETKFKKK